MKVQDVILMLGFIHGKMFSDKTDLPQSTSSSNFSLVGQENEAMSISSLSLLYLPSKPGLGGTME